MVQKFRKKPVVISALQWSGENKLEMLAFCGVYAKIFDIGDDEMALQIVTLEGIMDARINDYIIKGINGEFYPYRADIFKKTYELVTDLSVDNSEDNRELLGV